MIVLNISLICNKDFVFNNDFKRVAKIKISAAKISQTLNLGGEK